MPLSAQGRRGGESLRRMRAAERSVNPAKVCSYQAMARDGTALRTNIVAILQDYRNRECGRTVRRPKGESLLNSFGIRNLRFPAAEVVTASSVWRI